MGGGAGRAGRDPPGQEPPDDRIPHQLQVPAIPELDYGPSPAGREPALDFALVAAEEAMAGCGLTVGSRTGSLPPERWGVVYGSCNGGLVSGERALRAELAGEEPDWRLGLLVSPQAVAEELSAAFGLRGPVLSVNTACASGAHAIGHALELIRSGQADAVLVGGSDAFSDVVFAGFNSLESLAAGPAAPYSKDRDGLSLGEGAGMLVLARRDVATAAGAPVLADLLGYGLSADGYHPTAPHPDGIGAARAIGAALSAAGVEPADVDYINGHGTGTAKNDPAEVNAVRRALGAAAGRVPLSSTKSMIGHLLGAAGAVEGIVTVLAVRDQIAPPTAGFTGPDPRCDLDVVPNAARPATIDVAASNNFAFAGANACVVFGRAGHRQAPPPPAPEPIVITGLAALSPAGDGVEALAEAFRLGEPPRRTPAGDGTGPLAARVDFDPDRYLPARARRRMDRLSLLAVAACQDALADAGLDGIDRPAPRVGVVLGTGLGPMQSMEQFTRPLLEGGPALADPAVFPNTVYNAAAGQVAMRLGLTGVTSTVTGLHAAGAMALCVAADLLRAGAADVVVCPAVDVLSPAVLAAYRRFAGYTLAEGGYALVLERLPAAQARGARIRAELAGHGIASDARGAGRWDRDGAGLERAIRTALAAAGLRPADLSAVWANRTGLPAVDRPEQAALERVLAGAAPPLRSPKPVLGDPIGAGAHQAAALALAGWAGGEPGPVLVNSSSLGGTHVALALVGWKGQ